LDKKLEKLKEAVINALEEANEEEEPQSGKK